MSTAPTTMPPAPPAPPPARRQQGHAAPVAAPSAIAAIDPMRLLLQYYKLLVAAGVVGVVVGFVSYFALRFTFPRYYAEVAFECLGEVKDASDPRTGMLGQSRDEIEQFMETSVQVMKSDKILQRVVEERDVQDTKWGASYKTSEGLFDTAEALKKLRKITSSWRVPDTTLLRMTVATPDRLDSATIAKVVTDVFLDDVSQRTNRDERANIQQHEDQVRGLRKDLDNLDTRMEGLLGRNQLTSIRQESTVAYNAVQTLQPAMVELRERLSQSREQLKGYEDMLNKPGGAAFPEAIRNEIEHSQLIVQQDAQITSAKARIRALREGFGEAHPEVKQAERYIRALESERQKLIQEQMTNLFSSTVENLRNSVRNMEASEHEMMTKLEENRKLLADTTITIRQYEALDSERGEKLRKLSALETRLEDMKLRLARGSRVRILAPASPPNELGFPRMLPTVTLATVLIVGLVGGIIVLRELREQRVRGPGDVALIPRMRVLGVVPELSLDPSAPTRVELACRERPAGAIAESARQLRTALLKECESRGHKTILFVGGLPGAGATAILTNLALSLATTDVRVLLIDANLRRPSMHTHFGVAGAPGLAAVLLGGTPFEKAVQTTPPANLAIPRAGRRDPHVSERLVTASMAEVIRQAKRAYDIVLVDSSPAVVASDALALAGQVDAVVLVIRAYSEKRGLVARLRNQLGESRAEFLGVVVNAVRASAGGYFKRNFQVVHEYGREPAAELEPASALNGQAAAPAAANGTPRSVDS